MPYIYIIGLWISLLDSDVGSKGIFKITITPPGATKTRVVG
jgi:hypothetical protein